MNPLVNILCAPATVRYQSLKFDCKCYITPVSSCLITIWHCCVRCYFPHLYLSPASEVLKYLVSFPSLYSLPQVTGIALLGIGIWVSIDRTTVQELLLFDDPIFKAVGFAAIAIGGLITILGFLGCFGACHESRWMLWTVSVWWQSL